VYVLLYTLLLLLLLLLLKVFGSQRRRRLPKTFNSYTYRCAPPLATYLGLQLPTPPSLPTYR
jgi:hypothetical protein